MAFPLTKEELEATLTKDACYDFRLVRSFVMRRCWNIFQEEKIPFGQTVKRAWADVKEVCLKRGALV